MRVPSKNVISQGKIMWIRRSKSLDALRRYDEKDKNLNKNRLVRILKRNPSLKLQPQTNKRYFSFDHSSEYIYVYNFCSFLSYLRRAPPLALSPPICLSSFHLPRFFYQLGPCLLLDIFWKESSFGKIKNKFVDQYFSREKFFSIITY